MPGSNNKIVFFYAGHHYARNYGRRPVVAAHSHSGFELVYVLRDSLVTHFTGGESLRGVPGSVYLIPPGIEHTEIDNSRRTETIFAVMQLSLPQLPERPQVIETAADPYLGSWFRQLPELGWEGAIETASRLLEAVWERLGSLSGRREEEKVTHPALAAAIRIFRQHYADDLTISGVAARCRISYTRLNELFQTELGLGAEEFLTSIRMRHARSLLLDPHVSIAEAAEKSGYPDPNYFSRRFRFHHGLSPREYRADPRRYGGSDMV